ncbi:hypothetical protein PGTUg99_005251 [Puccinia graminis f. sp. tritici]|uniref:RING-type domain-containing protein n=1 Tax=Puccinia graminis f. sp. tritici TaxID=56615 RepID=A0A5B0PDD6_PUCGR|nr:hypothetical protein PGTUg99_005251 [Puccinia graminis f. sp. tritici]
MDQQSTTTNPIPIPIAGEEGPGGPNAAHEVAPSQLATDSYHVSGIVQCVQFASDITECPGAGALAEVEEVEFTIDIPPSHADTCPDSCSPSMCHLDWPACEDPQCACSVADSDLQDFYMLAECHQRYREMQGPHEDDFPSTYPIGPALETLPPHNQTLIKDYFTRLSAAYAELWDEKPSRVPMTEEELSELFGPQGSLDTLENIGDFHRERIESFFQSFERVFKRKNASLGPQLPTLPQLVDSLTKPAGYLKLESNEPDRQAAPSCSVCLDAYLPDEAVVTLPCDPSHHFHLHCAKGWLEAQQDCPVCRIPLDIFKEEDYSFLDDELEWD